MKHDVLGTSCHLSKKQIGPAKPGARMRVGPESHLGSHGKMVDTFTFLKENKAAGEKSFERVVRANPGKVAQDVSNRSRPVALNLVRSPTRSVSGQLQWEDRDPQRAERGRLLLRRRPHASQAVQGLP